MSYICWRGPGLAWCRDCSCCNLSSVFSYIRWNATVMRSERRWISELASCEAASTSHNKCCSRRCSTFWNNFQNIQGGPKNCTPHSRPLFCQILTDFQFVATLPCNLSLIACFQTLTFRKVVQQRMQGMLWFIMTTSLQSYCRIFQWKNF